MSQQSQTERSIAAINSMNEKFASIAERVQNLDKLMTPGGNFDSLKAAFYSISQIVQDLEDLKATKEIAHIGAGAHPLTNDVDSLLVQTLTLKKHIVIALTQHPAMREASASSASSNTPPQPPARSSPTKGPAPPPQNTASTASNDNGGNAARQALLESAKIPLSREEIAKLLLYTSKAFSMERITAQQKSRVKDLICERAGYLRIVLQQNDINMLFQALAIVGGDAE